MFEQQSLNNNENHSIHHINGEEFLWLQLRKRQLQNVEFYRKKSLGHYHVDFYSPDAKLIIEVDSPSASLATEPNYDAERDAYLTTLDLSILKFSSKEIFDEINSVLDLISQTLKLRLIQPTSA